MNLVYKSLFTAKQTDKPTLCFNTLVQVDCNNTSLMLNQSLRLKPTTFTNDTHSKEVN